MKTVTITRRSKALDALLRKALKEDLIVLNADGREFMLVAINDSVREIAVQRKNKKLMALLDQLGRQPATITLEELKGDLGLK